ncbi:hypothetical protein BJ508DRAFT_330414 [Ascobolus immersus RN42]|uniref:Uncharacterized protein n=1 Tax=Ascobolus immersus RN42 TaxID=1160509 RepID=A0A3N4HVU6_ASCIM|nr:hypothetical protein BJ508DRAFT_330414 [Ascobolus immersus RN42]
MSTETVLHHGEGSSTNPPKRIRLHHAEKDQPNDVMRYDLDLPSHRYGPLPHGTMKHPLSYIPVHKLSAPPDDLHSREYHAARASVMQVGEDQEHAAYVRTYHTALRDAHNVLLCPTSSGLIWILIDQDCSEILAGGLEIHIIPTMGGYCPAPGNMNACYDPLPVTLDPEYFLPGMYVDYLREEFSKAIGAMTLKTGHLCLLFRDKKHFSGNALRGKATEFGGLKIRAAVFNHKLTADVEIRPSVATGVPIADKPDWIDTSASLGLKLQYEGKEVLTVVTHAFVNLRFKNGLPLRDSWKPKVLYAKALEAVLKAKQKSKSFINRLRTSEPALIKGKEKEYVDDEPEDVDAEGHTRRGRFGWTTSVGKEVFIANTNAKLGVITECFDEPNRFFPYPHGFSHDLSLVESSSGLPKLTSPPGSAKIQPTWAAYDKVLGVRAPLYLCRMNVATGTWRVMDGHSVRSETQSAIVAGTQYLWETASRQHSISLLWRTAYDGDSATCASGSVLCLGSATAPTSEPILFQNFEGYLDTSFPRAGDPPAIGEKTTAGCSKEDSYCRRRLGNAPF